MVQDIQSQEDFVTKVLSTESGLVFVEFRASRCAPCKVLGPLIESLAQQNSSSMKLFKINVDEHQDLLADYQILSIPTVLVFKNGVLVEDALVGVLPLEIYQEVLDDHK